MEGKLGTVWPDLPKRRGDHLFTPETTERIAIVRNRGEGV
jgi:hypothetical protein